jgi:hypothetical protein
MPKIQLNISIEHDLADFIKIYAHENRTTASEVITQFILNLKHPNNKKSTDMISSDPYFRHALREVQSRLKDGSAQWCTFDEVFCE